MSDAIQGECARLHLAPRDLEILFAATRGQDSLSARRRRCNTSLKYAGISSSKSTTRSHAGPFSMMGKHSSSGPKALDTRLCHSDTSSMRTPTTIRRHRARAIEKEGQRGRERVAEGRQREGDIKTACARGEQRGQQCKSWIGLHALKIPLP